MADLGDLLSGIITVGEVVIDNPVGEILLCVGAGAIGIGAGIGLANIMSNTESAEMNIGNNSVRISTKRSTNSQ